MQEAPLIYIRTYNPINVFTFVYLSKKLSVTRFYFLLLSGPTTKCCLWLHAWCIFVCQYLAWSLKRSKAVNKSKRVVGVIGKGHMNGVIYALVSDQGNLRFRDLAGKTYNSKTPTSDNYFSNYAWLTTLFKSLIRDTLIGFLLWALYEQIIKGGLF